MKVKISKQELKECIKNAVVRALTEQKNPEVIKEWCDDDDTNDVVDRFLKNPKNQIPKRIKGGSAAKKAAMADIKKERDAEKHDDEAVEKREKQDSAED